MKNLMIGLVLFLVIGLLLTAISSASMKNVDIDRYITVSKDIVIVESG